MKKMVLLATAALVALMIFVPTALAQDTQPLPASGGQTQPLPESGGIGVSPSVLLPAAALLLGSGVVAYALVRRR